MNVKLKIKELRLQKNLTLKQLSQKSGVSTTHINDIENELKEPSMSIAIKIAKRIKRRVK